MVGVHTTQEISLQNSSSCSGSCVLVLSWTFHSGRKRTLTLFSQRWKESRERKQSGWKRSLQRNAACRSSCVLGRTWWVKAKSPLPLAGWKPKAGVQHSPEGVGTKWLSHVRLVAHSELGFNLFIQASLFLSMEAMWNTALHTSWNAVTNQRRSPGHVGGNTSVLPALWIWKRIVFLQLQALFPKHV